MTDASVVDEGNANEEDSGRSGSDWAMLRRTESRAKKAEAEAANAKRELAFTKAGINPDDPRMTYFVKGYDGDISTEAIRSAALEAGFLSKATDAPPPAATTAAQIRNAAAGAESAYSGGPDAVAGRMDEAYRAGGNQGLVSLLEREGFNIVSE